ncbi:MAG TPA: lipoyl synthase [Limnochordia bacterium]|nr:lipoyl synthase [Limnochordia bacterium]
MPPEQRLDFTSLGELSVLSNPAVPHAAPSEVMYPGGPQVDGGLLAPGDPIPENAGPGGRRPEWLKVRIGVGETYTGVKRLMRSEKLNTVCEEARCPNIYECWEQRTATFMILGDTCTRACRFCSVTTGRPADLDFAEPFRVAQAVSQLGLKHVVITSVTRDDATDGGAAIFADTIRATRRLNPGCAIEVLIPDLQGNWDALATIMAAEPDVLNHNMETVKRLYRRVRPKAIYAQSLELLRRAKALQPARPTKTGIMVGLGESREEIRELMDDVAAVGADILTVGQYLRPTGDHRHLPVERYVTPAEFAEIKEEGLARGIRHVESGPLVRSSYHAREQVAAVVP